MSVEAIFFLLLTVTVVTVILAVTVFVLTAQGLAAVIYEFNPPIYIMGVEKKVRITRLPLLKWLTVYEQ